MTFPFSRLPALAVLFILSWGLSPASATVAIRDIAWETRANSLRCVVATETPIQIDHRNLIAEKGLFYVDLYNVHCKILRPYVEHNDAFLRLHRFQGYPAEHVLRIICYPKEGVDYRVTLAESPPRVIIDIFRSTARAPGAYATASPGPVPTREPTAAPTPPPAAPTPPPPTPTPRPALTPTLAPTPGPAATPSGATPTVGATPAPPRRPTGSPELGRRRKVIIDPGHGGPNLGARGVVKAGSANVMEKDFNLQIAKRLAGMIQKAGNLDYYLTRTADVNVGLYERVEFAETIAEPGNGQCVFVAIHCNSAGNPDARGCEFYYLDETKSEATRELEALENDEEYKDELKGKEKSRLWNIFKQMEEDKLKQRKEEGFLLCRYQELAFQQGPYFQRYDRGVKSANFTVLKNFLMPAILVEVAFMSNREECKALLTEDFQYNIAAAIFNGVNFYFKFRDQSFRDLYYPLRPEIVR